MFTECLSGEALFVKSSIYDYGDVLGNLFSHQNSFKIQRKPKTEAGRIHEWISVTIPNCMRVGGIGAVPNLMVDFIIHNGTPVGQLHIACVNYDIFKDSHDQLTLIICCYYGHPNGKIYHCHVRPTGTFLTFRGIGG